LTPEEIWPEVWQYGFEDVEDSIQAGLDAEEDVRAGCTVPYHEVMALAVLMPGSEAMPAEREARRP
jgi:hypothetical protein